MTLFLLLWVFNTQSADLDQADALRREGKFFEAERLYLAQEPTAENHVRLGLALADLSLRLGNTPARRHKFQAYLTRSQGWRGTAALVLAALCLNDGNFSDFSTYSVVYLSEFPSDDPVRLRLLYPLARYTLSDPQGLSAREKTWFDACVILPNTQAYPDTLTETDLPIHLKWLFTLAQSPKHIPEPEPTMPLEDQIILTLGHARSDLARGAFAAAGQRFNQASPLLKDYRHPEYYLLYYRLLFHYFKAIQNEAEASTAEANLRQTQPLAVIPLTFWPKRVVTRAKISQERPPETVEPVQRPGNGEQQVALAPVQRPGNGEPQVSLAPAPVRVPPATEEPVQRPGNGEQQVALAPVQRPGNGEPQVSLAPGPVRVPPTTEEPVQRPGNGEQQVALAPVQRPGNGEQQVSLAPAPVRVPPATEEPVQRPGNGEPQVALAPAPAAALPSEQVEQPPETPETLANTPEAASVQVKTVAAPPPAPPPAVPVVDANAQAAATPEVQETPPAVEEPTTPAVAVAATTPPTLPSPAASLESAPPVAPAAAQPALAAAPPAAMPTETQPMAPDPESASAPSIADMAPPVVEAPRAAAKPAPPTPAKGQLVTSGPESTVSTMARPAADESGNTVTPRTHESVEAGLRSGKRSLELAIRQLPTDTQYLKIYRNFLFGLHFLLTSRLSDALDRLSVAEAQVAELPFPALELKIKLALGEYHQRSKQPQKADWYRLQALQIAAAPENLPIFASSEQPLPSPTAALLDVALVTPNPENVHKLLYYSELHNFVDLSIRAYRRGVLSENPVVSSQIRTIGNQLTRQIETLALKPDHRPDPNRYNATLDLWNKLWDQAIPYYREPAYPALKDLQRALVGRDRILSFVEGENQLGVLIVSKTQGFMLQLDRKASYLQLSDAEQLGFLIGRLGPFWEGEGDLILCLSPTFRQTGLLENVLGKLKTRNRLRYLSSLKAFAAPQKRTSCQDFSVHTDRGVPMTLPGTPRVFPLDTERFALETSLARTGHIVYDGPFNIDDKGLRFGTAVNPLYFHELVHKDPLLCSITLLMDRSTAWRKLLPELELISPSGAVSIYLVPRSAVPASFLPEQTSTGVRFP